MSSDILITGGRLVDGTGAPARDADVYVSGGRIKEVGSIHHAGEAKIIHAEGKIVCPGFVDVHTHSDFTILVDPLCQSSVRQGVTSEVVGNCGHSCAPVSSKFKTKLQESIFGYHPSVDINWRGFGEYLAKIESTRPAHNIASLVGHGAIRTAVMGFEDRDPTSEELDEMCMLVDESLNAGAVGMSSGLAYAPGCYAKPEEMLSLCKVVARYGRIYATHVRSYRTEDRLDAVKEAIETASQASAKLELSHHPASGNLRETLNVSELRARNKKIDISFDLHPYLWATSTLTVFLPRSILASGVSELREKLSDCLQDESTKSWHIPFPNLDWNRVVLENSKASPTFVGKSFREIAELLGVTPWEAVIRVLLSESEKDIYNVYARFELYKEEDVLAALRHDLSMIGSDGMSLANKGLLSSFRFHPRSYGTYPRIIHDLVLHRNVLSLEEAIRKMSARPAERFRLSNRGIVKHGYWADLVVFDPKRVKDNASYESPNEYPDGIDEVIVNGEIVINAGEHTLAQPGRVIRADEGDI